MTGFDARRVTLTAPDGTESAELVRVDQATRSIVDDVLDEALEELEGRLGEEASQALLGVLADRLLSSAAATTEDVPESTKGETSMSADSHNATFSGISGGKDSAALAIYMRDRVPEMEYFFCDTGRELPETYEYLQRLETVLGKPIARLNADRDFDHWLWVFGGALPSPQMRWCTKNLKIKPFEAWIGDDSVCTYIGIRADEDREGYISRKPNVTARFPFKEDGLVKEDILAHPRRSWGWVCRNIMSGARAQVVSSASSSASTSG